MTANRYQPKGGSAATGSCALCQRQTQLASSHILPAFAFRHVRRTSVTPYFRASNAPNRRVQDGLKVPLLCHDCEALISSYEDTFARRLFRPFHNNSSISVPYEDWLLKFCVSVSWRILTFAMRKAATAPHPSLSEHEEQIHLALGLWGGFLLGHESGVGDFDQHLLLLPQVTQAGSAWPPRLNRFFSRHIGMDVPTDETNALTYAKLPGFMLFGVISTPRQVWQGTRVLPKGLMEPQIYGMPPFLEGYLTEKAGAKWLNQVSARQQKKTDDEVIKNQHHWKSSGTYTALRSDLELFGTRALETYSDSGDPDEGS